MLERAVPDRNLIRLLALAAMLWALAGVRADAASVTYQLGSNVGAITLVFEADDAALTTPLDFSSGPAVVPGLIDVIFTYSGGVFDMRGGVDDTVFLVDPAANALSFTTGTVARPDENTLTALTLTFAQAMTPFPTLGDLFTYLVSGQVSGGNLSLRRADPAPVPVPAAAWLFASAAAGLAARRRRPKAAA